VRDYTIIRNKDVVNAFLDDVGKTAAVNFLSNEKEELAGGNGGCACTEPGDRDGNGTPDKDAGVALAVDRTAMLLGLISLWLVISA
jgi:hypothetical protein